MKRCDLCGRWSSLLKDGLCPFCRLRYAMGGRARARGPFALAAERDPSGCMMLRIIPTKEER